MMRCTLVCAGTEALLRYIFLLHASTDHGEQVQWCARQSAAYLLLISVLLPRLSLLCGPQQLWKEFLQSSIAIRLSLCWQQQGYHQDTASAGALVEYG